MCGIDNLGSNLGKCLPLPDWWQIDAKHNKDRVIDLARTHRALTDLCWGPNPLNCHSKEDVLYHISLSHTSQCVCILLLLEVQDQVLQRCNYEVQWLYKAWQRWKIDIKQKLSSCSCMLCCYQNHVEISIGEIILLTDSLYRQLSMAPIQMLINPHHHAIHNSTLLVFPSSKWQCWHLLDKEQHARVKKNNIHSYLLFIHIYTFVCNQI